MAKLSNKMIQLELDNIHIYLIETACLYTHEDKMKNDAILKTQRRTTNNLGEGLSGSVSQ